ncbi:MAG: hypothetical protein ACK4GJ_00290 [bacterium]
MARKFIKYCEFKKAGFSFHIFTRKPSFENHYHYSELKRVLEKVKEGFILNFAGANVFRVLISFKSMKEKNVLIWKSRIDFTRKVMEEIREVANNFVFFIPSAVWVYSPYLQDYFLQWESTVKNYKYLIYRLGIVLSYESQWVKVFSRILKMGVYPVFPPNFLFPFVYLEDFLENLFIDIVNFSESKVVDLFKIDSFNNFVKCLSNNLVRQKFFTKIPDFLSGWFLKMVFGNYGKVFDTLEFMDNIKKWSEMEEGLCSTFQQKMKISF